VIDPSSPVADQELRKTVEMIAGEKPARRTRRRRPPADPNEQRAGGRCLRKSSPFSRAAINYKASSDAKIVFDTIGKLAGADGDL